MQVELDILKQLEAIGSNPDEEEVKAACQVIADRYLKRFAIPPGIDPRITLRLKEQNDHYAPVLRSRYIIPHQRSNEDLAYPNSIAGISLALGQIITFPDDADREVEFRRLFFSGKLSEFLDRVDTLPESRVNHQHPSELKRLVNERRLRIGDLYQIGANHRQAIDGELERHGSFIVLPIPWVGSVLADDFRRTEEIGVLILHVDTPNNPFTGAFLAKLKTASHYFRFALDRRNTVWQVANRRRNLEQSLAITSRPSTQMSVPAYLETCREWLIEKSDALGSFYGSMHINRFGETNLKEFLLQFQNVNEVKAIQRCIDVVCENYWSTGRVEDAFNLTLRKRIRHEAMGHEVVYPPFGHPQDSSALLLAGPLKGLESNVEHLSEVLLASLRGDSTFTPENTVICFIDDNFATGVQAPAIFDQYFGRRTPQEEFHVRPLPEELQQHFRKFRILFATIYGSEQGVQNLREKGEELGLVLRVLEPLHLLDERTSWKAAASNATDINLLSAIFEKYGAPLLQDKVGPQWTDERRRQYSFGYGGLGQLFLFSYQTPTSIPVLFWRYGRVRGRFWKPLFWRESDYERFVRKLNLMDEHAKQPDAVWDLYQEWLGRRQGVSLTLDETNEIYKHLEPKFAPKKKELLALGRRGFKQFFDSALVGTKLRKVATPPAKMVEKRLQSQNDLDQETAISLLEWKPPLVPRQQENLKVLFSSFKPRPNQPADFFIPVSEAGHFLPRLRKKSKKVWTRSLLLKEYRKWKSST